MTQDERWFVKYNEVRDFIVRNKRNPSRHNIEDHLLLNHIKHNRKLMNKGALKMERVEKFKELLELAEQYNRKNQYSKTFPSLF